MQDGYKSDRVLAYAQCAAGGADAAVALVSFFSGGVVPAGCHTLIFKPAAQAIRFRDDGTNPTAAIGYPLATGVEFRYTSSNMPALKVIASTAGAVIDIIALG